MPADSTQNVILTIKTIYLKIKFCMQQCNLWTARTVVTLIHFSNNISNLHQIVTSVLKIQYDRITSYDKCGRYLLTRVKQLRI